jgi:RNA polymerase sigma-70 factor (ECF subfamily)
MATPTPPRTERGTALAGLLARAALSDQRAFGELYRQTSAHLYAVALRIVRDRAAAEEILQEAYVSIWHHAGTYDAAKSQPMTWLTSIVRNRCLDHVRQRELATVSMTAGDDEAEIDFPAEGPSPVELLLSSAAAHSVRECVNALEGPQKQAIALAFYHGLSHAELAAHLRQPLGTVKSWVRRGLERLKRCLERVATA